MCLCCILSLCAQALRVINNVAAGSELHKEAVMALVLPQQSLNYSLQTPWLIRFLQEMSNPQLRVVAVLCIINLTYPGENGTSSRVLRLREAGVESQLQRMVDDPCLDVKVIIYYYFNLPFIMWLSLILSKSFISIFMNHI